jgi:hypothetical protein
VEQDYEHNEFRKSRAEKLFLNFDRRCPMSIVQGDHGYTLPFITKKGTILDLTNAAVEVAISRGGEIINKTARIIDPLKGQCEVILSSSDLFVTGAYTYQWTVYYEDGRIFSGIPSSFYVRDKIRDLPPGDVENTVIVPFAKQTDFEALEQYVDGLVLDGVKGEDGLSAYQIWLNAGNTGNEADFLASLKGEKGDPGDGGTGGGTVPDNVILFEDWLGGESVTIDTGSTPPPADTTAPVLTITAGGTFTGTKSVTMSVNETATIYYTLDGSTPTTSSSVYSSPLSISATTTLKAFARDTAGNQSTVQTVTYTLDVTPPADTTAPSNVTNLQTSNVAQSTITLSWTASTSSDVASYDVFNSSTLLANVTGTTYNVTGLTASTQYTFTVKAKDTANNVASGTSVTVTTSAPADTTAPVLTITPAATFTDTQTVTMSANETATIWYTLDDSDPKTSGTKLQYTVPLTLTSTDTIKAYAVDSANNASAVQTVTYTKQDLSSHVTSGLVQYLDASDGSGTTWADKSGNGINATLTGFDNTVDSGWNSGALVVDGVNDIVSIAHNSLIKTFPMSLEFSVQVDNTSTPATLYDNRYPAAGTGNGIVVLLDTNNVICVWSSGTNINANSSVVMDKAVKTHIVITMTDSSLKIYKNGSLAQTIAKPSLTLGDRETRLLLRGDNQWKNKGKIWKFRHYNKELTASEVTQNYNVSQ